VIGLLRSAKKIFRIEGDPRRSPRPCKRRPLKGPFIKSDKKEKFLDRIFPRKIDVSSPRWGIVKGGEQDLPLDFSEDPALPVRANRGRTRLDGMQEVTCGRPGTFGPRKN